MNIGRRFYQFVILAYPKQFRDEYGSEMMRLFLDLSRRPGDQSGFWCWMLWDAATSAAREYLFYWRESVSRIFVLAAGLLALPFLFVLVNLLQYELGVPLPWNPFDAIYDPISDTVWRHLFTAVLLFSPILALALVMFSQVRISKGTGGSQLLVIEISRASTFVYAIVAVGLALMGVMGLYVFFENLPCLLGQQISC